MIKRRVARVLCVLVLGVFVGLSGDALPAIPKTYDFKVFLEDKDIGKQRFVVASRGERIQVRVEAKFDVKFWFFTAYTYWHTNIETWEGECLREIRATTNDNGETFFVRGTYRDGRMLLQTHAGERILNGCVKTFAYWDLDRLQSSHLLNSQTGEHQPVQLLMVGQETIPVRGAPTSTQHHRIISEKFTIDLWYDLNGDWVALQSTTSKGDKLRYQLQ